MGLFRGGTLHSLNIPILDAKKRKLFTAHKHKCWYKNWRGSLFKITKKMYFMKGTYFCTYIACALTVRGCSSVSWMYVVTSRLGSTGCNSITLVAAFILGDHCLWVINPLNDFFASPSGALWRLTILGLLSESLNAWNDFSALLLL